MTDEKDKIVLKPAEENPWYVFMLATITLDKDNNKLDKNNKPLGWHWFWGLYYLRHELPKFPKFDIKTIQDRLPKEHWLKKGSELPPHYSNDFKILVNNFKESYPNPNVITKIAFLERDFTKPIDFSNFIFPIETHIKKSVFSDDSDFSNTIFMEDVFFRHTKFCENANFKNARFYGKTARFIDVNFEKIAIFRDAIFKGYANFTRVKFNNPANFENVAVGSYAHFENTAFSSDANFKNAKFFSNAGFKNATFASDANFETATFSIQAFFEKTTFSSDVNFSHASFLKDAHFTDATFSSDINFSHASFLKDAYFTDATFSKNANFEKATFYGKTAKFRDATFTKIVTFKEAVFKGYANFKTSTFDGRTIFQKTQFELHAPRFYGAKFNNEMILNGIKLPEPKRYKKDEEEENDDDYQKRTEENQSAYETLVFLMEEQNKYHDRHFFFREEMRWRQLENKLKQQELKKESIKKKDEWCFSRRRIKKSWQRFENRLTIIFFWLYENLSDYGYGIGRAFVFWFSHIIVGMILITIMVLITADVELKDNLLCAIPVSFANANPLAFIGFEKGSLMYCYTNLGNLEQFSFGMIRVFQIIVGIPLLFLFLVTLRVRFRIK